MVVCSELVAALPLANLPSQDRAAAINVLLQVLLQQPSHACTLAYCSLSAYRKSCVIAGLQTGRCWAGLKEYEAADAVLAKGIESAQWLQVGRLSMPFL